MRRYPTTWCLGEQGIRVAPGSMWIRLTGLEHLRYTMASEWLQSAAASQALPDLELALGLAARRAAGQGTAQGLLEPPGAGGLRSCPRQLMEVGVCWAHQRRDFLAVAIQHPGVWKWAGDWLERIALLYHRHAKRRAAAPGTAAYTEQDVKLRRQTERIRKRAEAERDDPRQHAAVRRLQRLMLQNWGALTVFVEHPQIDLDNNVAEQALRPAVVGRKNYYGSGSRWSGGLAAAMMSLFATMEAWRINPRTWLNAYLQACARAGGQAPPYFEVFLPWCMTGAERARMRAPP